MEFWKWNLIKNPNHVLPKPKDFLPTVTLQPAVNTADPKGPSNPPPRPHSAFSLYSSR